MLCCEGIAVNVVYLDKASDVISHTIFGAKLVRPELVSFEKFDCLLKETSVWFGLKLAGNLPQQSVLGLILFSIFVGL